MKKLLPVLLLLVAAAAQASVVNLEWDANTESDLAYYTVYFATRSLLNDTTRQARLDPLVTKLSLGNVTQINLSTETAVNLAAGTTFFFRLTASDTWYNESGFNEKSAAEPVPDEVVAYFKIGDVNGDGLVTLTDLSLLLSAYFTNKPEADFNNDSKVTLTDLSLLLSNWGN